MNIEDYRASKFNEIACKAREAKAVSVIESFPELFEAIEESAKNGNCYLSIFPVYNMYNKITDEVIFALLQLNYNVYDRRKYSDPKDKDLPNFVEISWANKTEEIK